MAAAETETRLDFLERLGPDMSTSVFMCLNDPTDVVRVTSVSSAWRRFVIANGFCKMFCIRMCPEVSNFTAVIEARNSTESVEAESSHSTEWESLERDHRVYTNLVRHLVSPLSRRDCILESIGASSTDNFPDESVENTLEPNDRVDRRPSYWSSEGERDPKVPETLTYRLSSKVCVVNEIKVQPFQAFFQYGYPIYSSKAVRFRMGHSRLPKEMEMNMTDKSIAGQRSASNDYVWTYVSPVFPMVQENVLQSFKLPRPAICIGGILQIELLGRVQKQEMDGLYYICVCHVQVVGRPLSPVFDADILNNISGNSILKYYPDARECIKAGGASDDEMRGGSSSGWHTFAERIRQLRAGRGWNHVLLNTLLGNNGPVVEEDESDSEHEEHLE